MIRRVLVTRPEPGASETARRLDRLGFAPVLMPLSELRALPVDLAAVPGKIDAVAVTSAAALRHAPRELVSLLQGTPCYVVGGRTAEAARAAGFAEVIAGPGDAAGLAGMLIERIGAGGSLVYPCGRVRLSGFEARLAAAGVRVAAIETYDTVETAPDAPALMREPVDAALLHSLTAARSLLEIASRPAFAGLFAEAWLLCLSDRIASAFDALPGAKIKVAAEPTEEALLFLLTEQS